MYKHTDDIDLSNDFRYSEADRVMEPAVNLTISALEQNGALDTNFRALCVDLLKVFLSTHRSIKLLLSKEKDDPYLGPDALSLTREQIEKVFAIALISEDLARWSRVYLEYSWRTVFERYLFEREERGGLARFKTYLAQADPGIENMRQRLGISEDVRDAVEHDFLKRYGVTHNLPKRVPEIKLPSQPPTPNGVLKEVSAPQKPYLRRWYREYQFFCDFTHCGMSKLEVLHLFGRSSRFSTGQKEDYYAKEIDNAIAVGYVAVASVCAELHKLLDTTDIDRINKVMDFWEFLRPRILLAKPMWDLRSRDILPPVI